MSTLQEQKPSQCQSRGTNKDHWVCLSFLPFSSISHLQRIQNTCKNKYSVLELLFGWRLDISVILPLSKTIMLLGVIFKSFLLLFSAYKNKKQKTKNKTHVPTTQFKNRTSGTQSPSYPSMAPSFPTL